MIAAGEKEREKAKKEVLDAFKKAKGNRTHAALALEASPVALWKWINALELWEAIDALCEKEGFEVLPGAPRKKHHSPAKTS